MEEVCPIYEIILTLFHQGKTALKEVFTLFNVGLYEVLTNSQCTSHSRWLSTGSPVWKSRGVAAQKLSNVLLWTGLETKGILAT